MLARRDRMLVPRLTGWNENNLVERKVRGNLARSDEVSIVDGVERSTHHADSPGRWIHLCTSEKPTASNLVSRTFVFACVRFCFIAVTIRNVTETPKHESYSDEHSKSNESKDDGWQWELVDVLGFTG